MKYLNPLNLTAYPKYFLMLYRISLNLMIENSLLCRAQSHQKKHNLKVILTCPLCLIPEILSIYPNQIKPI